MGGCRTPGPRPGPAGPESLSFQWPELVTIQEGHSVDGVGEGGRYAVLLTARLAPAVHGSLARVRAAAPRPGSAQVVRRTGWTGGRRPAFLTLRLGFLLPVSRAQSSCPPGREAERGPGRLSQALLVWISGAPSGDCVLGLAPGPRHLRPECRGCWDPRLLLPPSLSSWPP